VHPDVTGSQEAFVELKQAYDILRRPADRRVYDDGGRRPKTGKIYPYPEHPYAFRARQGFYGSGADWKADWGNHFDGFKSTKTVDEREKEHWRRIIMYTSFGLIAVTLYNFGY
uniref:J domain-containing protein n=1 Tax=Panagrolaimus sp. JU765 TaxID=591449 RepID=A0AC34RCA5_9BILA